MKILTILTPAPNAELPKMLELRVPEEKHLWQMYLDGTVREMYFDDDPAIRVVLVLESENEETAREALAGLPMVREKVLQTQIIPLKPWKPLELLFAEQRA